MKLTISKSALHKALSIVSKGMASNSTLPILAGVLMRAGDGTLTLESTDNTVSIRHKVPANVEEEGSTVISGKMAVGIVKNLPDSAVSISTDGPQLRITCEKARYRLNTLDPRDFPDFPEPDINVYAKLPAQTLSEMTSKVSKVAGKDVSRPVLTGINVEVSDGRMTLSATDSYRMATCVSGVSSDTEFSAIIPAATMSDALSLPSLPDELGIGISGTQVVFDLGATTFVSRRIEGNFPNIARLVPQAFNTAVDVDADEMSQALKRVSVVAKSNPSVMLSAEGLFLELHASSQDLGESTEQVTMEREGDPVRVALNARFLADCLDSVSGELRIELSGEMQPAVFRSHGDIELCALIMPVRI